MNTLLKTHLPTLRMLLSAFFAVFGCGGAKALDSSLDGIYTSPGLATQVIVAGGEARSNSILNDHQAFSDQFISATNGVLTGGIRITYSFEESGGDSVFTVRYFVDGELILTFVSEMKVTVVENTGDKYRSRTVWTMTVSGPSIGNFNLSTLTVEETFVFDTSNFTCVYTDAGFTSTLQRTSTGTGSGQRSPIVPRNANWRVTVIISFPIVNPTRPTWVDPPFAGGFEYKIAKGRKERIASIQLPKGFGNKLKVYAKPKSKGKAKLVGTFKSGAKINLLKKKGFKAGAASVLIRNIKPKVDLKKRAPYPVGLTFTSLDEAAAKVTTKPTNVSKGK